MNIAVINQSPNVGKTIIAQYLLQPRLKSKYIGVSNNSADMISKKQDARITAENFDDIQDRVMEQDNVVVDVSSTQADKFLKQMEKYKGSHEDYRYFIVPTTADIKSLRETKYTLIRLMDLGVKAHQIRLIFNKSLVENPNIQQLEWLDMQAIATQYGIQVPTAYLYCNDVYPMLERYHLDFFALRNEEMIDIKHFNHPSLNALYALQHSAHMAQNNLNDVFADLGLVE